MNVSRNFMLVGAAYLLLGILIGMYMGGSGDHTLVPLHAHINLLGFTLMTVFGILFRLIPAMGANMLATLQFWLHQIGAAVLLILLFLLLTGRMAEASMAPWAPISELLVLLSVLVYGWNLIRNGR